MADITFLERIINLTSFDDRDDITPVTGLQVYNTTTNSTNTYNSVNWTNDVIDSSVDIDLEYGNDYFFRGTTAEWKLPAVNTNIAGRQNMITIKNKGLGDLTIVTSALANVLFTTSLTNTITLSIGDAITVMPDGTTLNVE